ncbi:MAG: carbon-nitrogen hydrolase family protein, partial [Bacillota bacterium]
RPEKNLNRARKMIIEAGFKNCDLIVLPECLDLGWTFPDAHNMATSIPGKYSDIICKAARKTDIFVVAGLTEKRNNEIFNSAILVSPDGKIILKYSKINVLEIALDIYNIGYSLKVVDTPLGKVGVNICADNFPDSYVLGHSLARMGADIILSPCAWVVDADHDNDEDPYGEMWEKSYSKMAYLFQIPVVGVSNVGWIEAGVWEGRKCIGSSLAVNAEGEVIYQGPYGVESQTLDVISVEIKEKKVRGTGISSWIKDREKRYKELSK